MTERKAKHYQIVKINLAEHQILSATILSIPSAGQIGTNDSAIVSTSYDSVCDKIWLQNLQLGDIYQSDTDNDKNQNSTEQPEDSSINITKCIYSNDQGK